PDSELTGKSVRELGFRSRFGVSIIGIRRRNSLLEGALTDEPLEVGDTLLAIGDWRCIQQLQQQKRDLLLLALPAEIDEAVPAHSQAPHALFSLALMVALMITDVIPGPIAALIACLLMGKFRCIDMESAWKAIHWPGLILIAGMMPFALALQKTGGVALVVQGLMDVAGSRGPHVMLLCLFVLCATIGLFISNTATAVLMAPVGVAAAQQVGVSPYPFTMIIAIAASAAFMTPVSSPVNTLVLGPGGYRFGDFVKIGVPFTLVVMAVSVLLVPLLFPF
ncbi:MAG: SLC13 family permease, partial [Mixta calida]|nr:SLC13 family permease [Mixta calida]